jgi:hypothetical protein
MVRIAGKVNGLFLSAIAAAARGRWIRHSPNGATGSFPGAAPCVAVGWLAAQAERPLFLRLEPEDRVRVVSALAGLIILGFTMILLVSWGARVTRRYMNRPIHGQHGNAPSADDWAKKPLHADNDWTDESDEPRDSDKP